MDLSHSMLVKGPRETNGCYWLSRFSCVIRVVFVSVEFNKLSAQQKDEMFNFFDRKYVSHWSKFHCIYVSDLQWVIISSGNDFNRRQVLTWTNGHQVYWRIYASQGPNILTEYFWITHKMPHTGLIAVNYKNITFIPPSSFTVPRVKYSIQIRSMSCCMHDDLGHKNGVSRDAD